jgi:hypothetical protein
MINLQSKNWHLLFTFFSAAGIIVSAVSLLEAINEKNNAQTFRRIISILLFTFWLITSWKSYRKKALEKTP